MNIFVSMQFKIGELLKTNNNEVVTMDGNKMMEKPGMITQVSMCQVKEPRADIPCAQLVPIAFGVPQSYKILFKHKYFNYFIQ